MKISRLIGLAAGLLIVLFAGCGPPKADREFRIGLLAILTGDMSAFGKVMQEAAELAADQANREGGLLVGGARLRVTVVVKDSQTSPELAVNAAQELINRENISAMVGPALSRQAIPVARLAERASVPMVTQLATNPEVTRDTRFAFRVCYTDDFQGEVLARFACERLKAESAGILYDLANAYNKGIAEIFSRVFQKQGGRIAASESYITGAKDFRAQLKRIKAAGPAVLFLPNFTEELKPQIDQIQELGLAARILGCDSMDYWDPAYNAMLEGACFSTHFDPNVPDGKARAFVDAYRARFGADPKYVEALTYDAFDLLFAVARARGSVEAGALAEGLRGIGRFEGVTGIMEFNGSPDPRKSVVIMNVKDGVPRFMARIDP